MYKGVATKLVTEFESNKIIKNILYTADLLKRKQIRYPYLETQLVKDLFNIGLIIVNKKQLIKNQNTYISDIYLEMFKLLKNDKHNKIIIQFNKTEINTIQAIIKKAVSIAIQQFSLKKEFEQQYIFYLESLILEKELIIKEKINKLYINIDNKKEGYKYRLSLPVKETFNNKKFLIILINLLHENTIKLSDRKLSKVSNPRLKEQLMNKEFKGIIEPTLIGIPPFMVGESTGNPVANYDINEFMRLDNQSKLMYKRLQIIFDKEIKKKGLPTSFDIKLHPTGIQINYLNKMVKVSLSDVIVNNKYVFYKNDNTFLSTWLVWVFYQEEINFPEHIIDFVVSILSKASNLNYPVQIK